MKNIIPLMIALAISACLCAGCTMTENEVTSTGSGVSAHIEFEF